MFNLNDPAIVVAVFAAGASLIVALASFIVSGFGFWLTYRSEKKKLAEELKLEFSAEKAIRILLSHGWKLRSFETMKAHLPGFQENERKQLLVRSGAIAFQSPQLEKKEYWGLAENCLDLLSNSTGDVDFRLAGDPPELTKVSRNSDRNDQREE